MIPRRSTVRWGNNTRLSATIRHEPHRVAERAETVGYFDRRASTWSNDYTRDRYLQKRLQLVLSWMRDHPSGLRILDYGCGSGIFLKRLIDIGHTMTGVDASAEMLASARRMLQTTVSATSFKLEQVYDNRRGEFLSDDYDGILSLGVLEYLDEPLAVLESLVSRLKPGGFLIISLPNHPSLLRCFERITKPAVLRAVGHFGVLGSLFPRLAGPDVCFKYQKYQFDVRELQRVLAKLGLRTNRICYHGAPRLLALVEGSPVIGNTFIAEFRKLSLLA